MVNPFSELNQWTKEELTNLSVKQLIDLRRSAVFSNDHFFLFDVNTTDVFFRKTDLRSEFFDFTDRLIVQKSAANNQNSS